MLNREDMGSSGDQGTKDPWLTSDYPGTDSASLQEMLDSDMRYGIDNSLNTPSTSGTNNTSVATDMNSDLGLSFDDYASLDLENDLVSYSYDLNTWLSSASLDDCGNENSNSNFNLDVDCGDVSSLMVDPISVMPHSAQISPPLQIEDETEEPLLFLAELETRDETVNVEEDTDNNENDTENEQCTNDTTESEGSEMERGVQRVLAIKTNAVPPRTIKTIPPVVKPHNGAINDIRTHRVVRRPTAAQNVKKQMYNNNNHVTTPRSTGVKRERDFDMSDYENAPAYPKPAYSYSCLIAMALKNSQTGSLPVSEIYNFMCEHFPYFKTAPNGWKNSVRHNLSLNKCFEKIEKPEGNGNQRKGCLWAITPTKVTKMDEEVAKWSRKDPMAIKKAMIYPDQLELLERGEMRYASAGSDITEESGESSEDDIHRLHSSMAANSLTDSYDESSQDCEVDLNDPHYEEVSIDDTYEYDTTQPRKRQKAMPGEIRAVYRPVGTTRSRSPLLFRTTGDQFIKIE